jgi:two-component system NtrC family response regulator
LALLRALQEGEISRVGSTAPRRVDVRVIAATQRQPTQAVRDGILRADLYYRLAVLPCELPPLRERRDDIPLLVDRFLDRAAEELALPRPEIAPDVWPLLAAHNWPGNVRELENLVRRLVATTRGTVRAADLPAELRSVAVVDVVDEGALAPAAQGGERERVLAAIAAARTLGDAARALGIGRSTLYRWLARYGLKARRTFKSS